jgi:hypothetical protein
MPFYNTFNYGGQLSDHRGHWMIMMTSCQVEERNWKLVFGYDTFYFFEGETQFSENIQLVQKFAQKLLHALIGRVSSTLDKKYMKLAHFLTPLVIK